MSTTYDNQTYQNAKYESELGMCTCVHVRVCERVHACMPVCVYIMYVSGTVCPCVFMW